MTIKEVVDYIEAYNTRLGNQQRELYLLADLISAFVWTRYSGKQIPSYEEVFPSTDDESRENNNRRIRQLMEVFMINHNAQRKKQLGGEVL